MPVYPFLCPAYTAHTHARALRALCIGFNGTRGVTKYGNTGRDRVPARSAVRQGIGPTHAGQVLPVRGAGLKRNETSALYWLHRAAIRNEREAWLLIGRHVPFEV